jgi:hypothetical protein
MNENFFVKLSKKLILKSIWNVYYFFVWNTKKNSILYINVWRKNIFDIYVTEYGTVLTTILPILFLYLNTESNTSNVNNT